MPTLGARPSRGAGLLETYHLIRRVSDKDPHTRFVVVAISDGRANQGMTELAVKEEVARRAGPLLELRRTDYLVIETEYKSGFMCQPRLPPPGNLLHDLRSQSRIPDADRQQNVLRKLARILLVCQRGRRTVSAKRS